MAKRFDARAWSIVAVLWACCILCAVALASDAPTAPVVSPLDLGFSGLYNLDFAGAQKDFATWQQQHPDDPVGPVSEAAGFLFSEFNRLGVLEAQFYENDDTFFGRPKLTPDPALREHFKNAIGRSETLAHARLEKDPKGSGWALCADVVVGIAGRLRGAHRKAKHRIIAFYKAGFGLGPAAACGLSRLLRRFAGNGL